MVLRDVEKAFDKVWHSGLKYKIVQLGLPDILEKKIMPLFRQQEGKNKFW